MAAKSKRAGAKKAKRAATTKPKRAAKPKRVAAKPKRPATRTRRAAPAKTKRTTSVARPKAVAKPKAIAKAEMLIRRPVADVFIAFVDPLITSNFWFTKGSDRLHMGKTVRWEWEMYGFAIDIDVMAVDENRRILIEWPGDGGKTRVEWTFTARPDNTTFVSIANSGFHGSSDDVIAQAIGSTEGFSLVLAGAKAFLEQGLYLDLIADRHPDGLPH